MLLREFFLFLVNLIARVIRGKLENLGILASQINSESSQGQDDAYNSDGHVHHSVLQVIYMASAVASMPAVSASSLLS